MVGFLEAEAVRGSEPGDSGGCSSRDLGVLRWVVVLLLIDFAL